MNFKSIATIITFTIALGQLHAQNIESNSLNQYSFDLYNEAKFENENLFLSPISTCFTLLSAYEGADNQTKEEFENVLYLKNSAFVNNDYSYRLALKTDSLSGLKISNAIWVDKKLQVESAFKKGISKKYATYFKQAEFANTEQAALDINRWIAANTNQRITNMVSLSDVNSETKLMILNAVYFKGEWFRKFNKSKTTEATFFTDDDNQYTIDFMKITEKLNYYENEAFQFVSKPYKDSDLSFCMMLPKGLFGLEAVEKSLNADFFNEILEKTSNNEVWISMPKIKMESTNKLKEALINLGLKSMFNNEADFSGITKKEPLWFEQVLHKTYIDLNEDFTEASAATTSVMRITGLPSYKVFKADHPFVFFIIDNKTKAIVFVGRYVTPEDGKMIEKEFLAGNLEKRKIKKKLGFAPDGNKILILITDGKKMKKVDIQDVNMNAIDHLEVYKKEEVKKYTTEDYDSVLVLTVKKIKKALNN